MTGGSVVGCITNDHGGAVRVDGSGVKISIGNAGFYSNMTMDSSDNSHGGAIYSDYSDCEVNVKNTVFEGNYSEDNGGAVYINDGKFTAEGCLFNDNKCLDDGGAVYVESGSEATFNNCVFTNNRSDGHAGAIYCNSSDGTRISGTLKNNSAGGAGGALFVNGNAVSVQDACITSNVAGDRGGAMYVDEMYDINIQGLLKVRDNYKTNKSRDDIFLDSIGVATARIYNGGLYDGSEVWVLTASSSQTVSEYISAYQQRYFHCDDSSKAFQFSADSSKTLSQRLITSAIGSGNVRFIIITVAAVIAAVVITAIIKSKKKGADKNENVGVVYAIFNSMACGVADYGENNWAQRVETSDVKARVASGSENAALDRSYKDYAYDLYPQLQYFCEQYAKAKQYVDTNGMDSLKKGVEKTSECDISDETMEKIENCEEFDEKETYYLYLQAYDILSQYKYDETTTLAEHIVYLGSLSYKQDADLRNIYPLVDALTQGQIGVFRVAGVVQMAMSLINNEVILEKTNEYLKEVYDLIKDAYNGKTEHLEIWINTDQTPYNSVIAKTDAEIISTRSGMEFDNLVKENGFEKKLDKAMTLTFVISSAINIASFVVTVGANIAVISKAGVTAWWVGQSVSAWAVCYNAISFATGSILSSILGIMGCAVIIAGYIALIAICVIMLVSFGNWIYKQFKGEDDSLEYTLSDIPKDVYDYRNRAYLHYKAVELNKTGKSADLNAENGRRFAALYYTKNASAGNPIKINPDGNEFTVVSGDTAAPGGYQSVRYFGPGAAANLNAYTKNKSAKSIFLSYYKCAQAPVNEGEESEAEEITTDGGKYLSSLKVAVQKTETAAKDELKKSGFTPIDVNLSGFYGVEDGTYAYLGYQTTTIEKEAITDIRAVPQGIGTGESFYFGNIPYYRATFWEAAEIVNKHMNAPKSVFDILHNGENSRMYTKLQNARNGIGRVGKVAMVVKWVSFALFAVAFIADIYAVVEYFTADEITEEKIPHHLLSAVNTPYGEDYVYYQTVKNLKGEAADTNNHEADAKIGWLVLYTTKDKAAGDPILADNLKLQTGSTNFKEGTSFVHLFNETAALNLTAELYTGAKDSANGTYLIFDRDASTLIGSAVTNGTAAIIGVGGLAVGAVLGALITKLTGKKKNKEAAAEA